MTNWHLARWQNGALTTWEITMSPELAAIIVRAERVAVAFRGDYAAIIDWASYQPLWVQRAFRELDRPTYDSLSPALRELLRTAWPMWGLDRRVA